MTKYDTYTPEIPVTETRQPLPPAPENVSSRPRRDKKNGRKPQRKAESAPRAKERPSISAPKMPSVNPAEIPGILKAWAQSQTVRLVTGIVLGCAGVYLGISFFSYLAECVADQSAIWNSETGTLPPVANSGGEAGARISQLLINDGYGLGAAVLVVWLLVMSLKELTGRPRFKTVNFTIKCLVAFITVSLIIGLLTIGVSTPVNWGGYHGRYVNEFIIRFFGWTGGATLCVMMLGIFVVICLRDIINWILRLKRIRDERRRKRREAEAEQLRREEEIAEMARREDEDAVRAGENTAPAEVDRPEGYMTFSDTDNTLYDEIPDLEEEERERHPAEPQPETVPEPVCREEEPEPAAAAPAAVSVSAAPVAESPSLPAPQAVSDEAPDGAGSSDSEPAPDLEPEPDSEPSPAENPMVVNVGTVALGDAAKYRTVVEKYRFPAYELLRPGVEKISVDATEQLENKEKIRKTLLDFGIPIVSIEATVGPTVTLYEIRPDKGVKIAKIRNLVDDIALSLSAIGVRIIAPIPGKGTVGIEVANKDPQTVSMRTVIQSRRYQESKYKLPVALGCTISNDVYIADLAKMPHLLVAGATGQGKSVGLNALIASLLYCKRPDELKFVMIDPKMVEFSLYAKIEKHYLAKLPDVEEPIITDMSKVVATLSSLCVEMDDRYQLLKDAQVRNIEEYNTKIREGRLNPSKGHRFMPYIVVIVDEFSDLIMTSGKEVEMPIARLAQKARAVGMHVIIATQRPSTNVITGIIKANFPVRIAFKVSSGVDSKTILDTTGAQQLIGRGDMLVSNNSEMVRVQCAFIDTPEVEAICEHIEAQPYGQGAYILPEPVTTGDGEEGGPVAGNNFGERDPLFDECARVVVMSNTASTSSLQRRYAIGYNRAGKIMDQLEAAGIVGPAQGGKPRAVLVDQIGLESILGS